MPETTQPLTWQIDDFLAGVHTCPNYEKRPVNSLVKAKNAVLDRCGFITRRPGFSDHTTLATHRSLVVHDFGEFYRGNIGFDLDDRSMLFFVYDDDAGGKDLKIMRDLDIDSAAMSDEVSQVTLVPYNDATGYHADMVAALNSSGNPIVVTGGKEASLVAHKYLLSAGTDSSFTDTNSDPNLGMRIWISAFDRLWNADSDDETIIGNLYYSDAGAHETWSRTANVIRVTQNRRERITALREWKGRLIVIGLESQIRLLEVGADPTSDWFLQTLSNDIGIASNRSVVHALDDLFFMDQNGEVRSLKQTASALNASVQPIAISSVISDQLDSLRTYGSHFVEAAFWDENYVIHGHDSTTLANNNSLMWAYNTRFNSWTGPWTAYPSSSTADKGSPVFSMRAFISRGDISSSVSDPEHRLYIVVGPASDKTMLAHLDSTQVVDQNAGANVDFEFEIITRPQDFNAPHQTKVVKWVEIDYGDPEADFSAAASFNVFARKDFASGWTTLGTEVYDADVGLGRAKFSMKGIGRGRTFQIRITQTARNDGPKIRSMRFHYLPDPVVDR